LVRKCLAFIPLCVFCFFSSYHAQILLWGMNECCRRARGMSIWLDRLPMKLLHVISNKQISIVRGTEALPMPNSSCMACSICGACAGRSRVSSSNLRLLEMETSSSFPNRGIIAFD
jgi:hypothetical protein